MTTTVKTTKAGARHYTIGGEKYPSVTTVLNVISKPALIPWAKKVSLEKVRQELYHASDEISQGNVLLEGHDSIDELIEAARTRPDEVAGAAADLGLRAHKYVEELIKEEGALPEPEPDIAPAVQAFLDWREQAGLDIKAVEQVVYSREYGYAGTLDMLGRDEQGRVYVVDLKTSNGIYPEYALQVSAYAQAWYEMHSLDNVEGAMVVRLGKANAEFEVREVADWITTFIRGFKPALDLWSALRGEIWRE